MPEINQKLLLPNAEELYCVMLNRMEHLIQKDMILVGVRSGGVWLAERLQNDLKKTTPLGCISSSLHRDDFSRRGLAVAKGSTHLPFDVDGKKILLIDDVIYTGRTIRAVMNELFDFGRPATVKLAVLVDRGGRELPIEPIASAAQMVLPEDQRVSLGKNDEGRLIFNFERM